MATGYTTAPYKPTLPAGFLDPAGYNMANNAATTINAIPQPVQQQPTPTPPPVTNNAPVVDPAVTAARNDYGSQKSNLYSSITEATNNAGTSLNSGILDFMDSLRTGQRSIDSKGVDNELAKLQGTQSAYGSVGRGIKSGGVLLNNKNAANSSAAEALARAYGEVGRQQLSSVGNQYAQNQRGIDQSQLSFDEQAAQGVRHLQEGKTAAVNQIVSDARNQLAALNAAAAKATLPDRIDIEREKEVIKAKVLAQLQQYDQQIQNAPGSVSPLGQDQRAIQANQLAQAGAAPENAFNFTSEVPAQYQNTGPFASELPIFTYNKRTS